MFLDGTELFPNFSEVTRIASMTIASLACLPSSGQLLRVFL